MMLRLFFWGKILRMDENRWVKRVYEESRRRAGNPRVKLELVQSHQEMARGSRLGEGVDSTVYRAGLEGYGQRKGSPDGAEGVADRHGCQVEAELIPVREDRTEA